MSYATVEVHHDQEIAWIRLARPDAGNALDGHACAELLHALGHAVADEWIRVIAIAAHGPAFSVAGDLATPLAIAPRSPHPSIDAGPLLQAMRDCPRPIVAIVHGECHSAGLGLVAAADLAIASSRARFWMPELRGGLWPALPLAAVARAIGPRRALELAMAGEPIDARAAQQLGLVQRTVEPEQLDTEAFVLLRGLGQRSPSALRHGLPAFRRGLDEDLGPALARARAALTGLLATADAQEALAAYQAGRKPLWRDE